MKITPNGIAVLENDTHISRWVEEHGRLDFDRWMLDIVEAYINEGAWVVDAGAYIGDHTLAYARRAGQTGNVIAFEPNPAAFECLEYNMEKLEARENIIVDTQNCGLSDEAGNIPLILSDNVGASYLEAESETKEGAKLIALDDLYLPQLNFLKMDIEGFERKALAGGRKTIVKHKPIIFLEINKAALARNGSSFADIRAYLGTLGYHRDRIVQPYVKTPDEELQFDCLFVP